jgi:CubicO group peptidase (beta-lactamase class C family)
MKSIRTSVILAVCLIAVSAPRAAAQSKPQKIDELLARYNEYRQFNGSALVSENGEVIFKKGYGMANMEWAIPNTPDTKFRLGSITKQFTAMLILQLVGEGKLKLDGKVTDYLPDYPIVNGDRITIHHLLTHSSGIPSYTDSPSLMREVGRDPFTPTAFLKFFADSTLLFEPGSRFVYNNSGYFLLGVIIEKITGMPYAQVLKERIFNPLGMHDSGYDLPQPLLPKRAAGYEKRGSGYVNAEYLDMTIPYAAGSLYSTVEDLYRWDQALYTDKLLSKELKELCFKPYIQLPGGAGPAGGYAYGWFIGRRAVGESTDSVSVIEHGGGINGFNTIITRVPSQKHLIVLLNNTGGTRLGEMARGILGILYNKPVAPPRQSIADALREIIASQGMEKALAEYAGMKDDKKTYYLSENEMNNLGYEFLRSGEVDVAIEVFKLNVEAFPQSFNVYDSLGEAYMEKGNNELAIKNYEKSVALNPRNTGGIEALKKLKAQ